MGEQMRFESRKSAAVTHSGGFGLEHDDSDIKLWNGPDNIL